MDREPSTDDAFHLCHHIAQVLDSKFAISSQRYNLRLSADYTNDRIEWKSRLTFLRTIERALATLSTEQRARLTAGGIAFNLSEPLDWDRENAHPSHANNSYPSIRWTQRDPTTGHNHGAIKHFDMDQPTALALLLKKAASGADIWA